MLPRLPSFLLRHPAIPDWLSILLATAIFAALLGWQNGLGRLDRGMYDTFLGTREKPAHGDIVIVAIDEFSLSQLGRWPWPRALHADLIKRIDAAGPAAIGLDLILSEPDPDGDRNLAAAMRASGKTVLPVLDADSGIDPSTRRPAGELAGAAAALGHIDFQTDPDGVVRSVRLREGGGNINSRPQPHAHFALALASVGTGARHMVMQPSGAKDAAPAGSDGGMLYIPFAGGNGHFQAVPYVAALRGEVPASFFAGKYVLVGATAAGMSDSYPTPASGAEGAMPGVELHANILAALLGGESITIAPRWQTALLSVVPVLVAMAGFLWLSPRASLLLCVGLIAATLAGSYLALLSGRWIAPAGAVIALAIAYLLWNWRRLDAAIRYLDQEFARLDSEPSLLPHTPGFPQAPAGKIGDGLDRRINAMTTAARRVRDLRRFMSDSIDSLPYATLVTTVDGHVLISNRHANAYFSSIGVTDVRDALLPYLFSRLSAPRLVGQDNGGSADWWNLTDPTHAPRVAEGLGATDPNGSDLLIKSAPCHDADDHISGWIVTIIDLSAIRRAERSNDDLLRFLSHDMRSPQASILALLELQKDPASALSQNDLFARIESACRKTISLTESLVQLARAEARDYRLEEMDFQDLLIDATDEMWAYAKDRHVYLVSDIAEGEYPVVVDRGLMARVLVNLVSNAIRYSPAGSRVSCLLHLDDEFYTPQIVCVIKDQGYGIPKEDLARLFQQSVSGRNGGSVQCEGNGLGLRFVRTVIARHRGEIAAESELGEGTTITVRLPLAI